MRFKRPYIKVTYYEVTLETKGQALGLGFKSSTVTLVKPGMWAESVGIQTGDQICSVDDEDFISATDMERVSYLKRKGLLRIEMKRPAVHKAEASEMRKSMRKSVQNMERISVADPAEEGRKQNNFSRDDRSPIRREEAREELGFFSLLKVCCGGGSTYKDDFVVDGRRGNSDW